MIEPPIVAIFPLAALAQDWSYVGWLLRDSRGILFSFLFRRWIAVMWKDERRVVLGSSGNRAVPKGKAIWEFDGKQWALKSLQAENGGVAGDPPSIQGRFKGQLRATPCVEPAAV